MVCVCLYTRVHTHKLLGYLMWAQVWDAHLESQKNSDRLMRSIHVDRIGVYSTFVYEYAVLRVLMIWANCFFLLTCLFFFSKVEDVTTISKSQSLTSVSITAPWEFQTKLLLYFFTSNKKSKLHFTSLSVALMRDKMHFLHVDVDTSTLPAPALPWF